MNKKYRFKGFEEVIIKLLGLIFGFGMAMAIYHILYIIMI